MRRIFLFMLMTALLLSFNSCSDSESNPLISSGNTITMKVGGELKTFNTVVVSQVPYDSYVDLIITASNSGNPTDFVKFGLGKGDIGEGHSWGFEYSVNGTSFFESGETSKVNSNITTNGDNKLTGTFSGSVTSVENVRLELTQGSFDITY